MYYFFKYITLYLIACGIIVTLFGELAIGHIKGILSALSLIAIKDIIQKLSEKSV